MKIVMINDCAFVGETLLKFMPPTVEKQHIRRTRNFASKTFGLAYRILKTHGDVYHAHYLLQDCYLATSLGKKPLVGHAHGSDLRQQLFSQKWGWIVKSNLKKSDKILVSQPTILATAKEYNPTAEYLPIPFDPEFFFPEPVLQERKEKVVFLASVHNFQIKGTDKFLHALSKVAIPVKILTFGFGKDFIKAKELTKDLKLNVEFMNRVPHDKMNQVYWGSDLVLGSFSIGQLDTVAIEAMACGRPVVHSVSKKHFKICPLEELQSEDQAIEIINKLLTDRREIERRVANQKAYVNSVHLGPIVASRVNTIYSDLTKK